MARDPGLQPERTSLARQRTVLAVVLGSTVLALGQLRFGNPSLAIAAGLIATAAVVPGVIRHRERDPVALERARQQPSWQLLFRTGVLVVSLALVGALAATWHLLNR